MGFFGHRWHADAAHPPPFGIRSAVWGTCGLLAATGLVATGHAVLPALALFGLGVALGRAQDRAAFFAEELDVLSELRDRELSEREYRRRRGALEDTLTRLPNGALLADRLPRALERARRRESRLGLLDVGVDRFKKVRQSLGRSTGRHLLKVVGQRLQETIQAFERGEEEAGRLPIPSVTLFRLEGDEFAILLEEMGTLREATRLSTMILRAFSSPVSLGRREVLLTLSVGVAAGPARYADGAEMLRDAHTALNRAKEQGRDRYEVFDRQMLAEVESAMHLQTELHQAIEQDRLELYYQPVLALAGKELYGFEALIRWRHPERGLMLPAEFIGLAEETGQIVELTRWVFRRALAQLAEWSERYPERDDLSLNVNISPKYLLHPKLPTDLGLLFRNAEVDLSRLHLEITETSFIDQPEKVASVLEGLKEWGVRIAVDDFGTGFSSLSMLHALPVDILKIDREFVSLLCEDRSAKRIVESIAGLARELRLDVVAEGIETRRQLNALTRLGCGYGQGFLLGRPERSEQAEQRIAATVRRRRKTRKPA